MAGNDIIMYEGYGFGGRKSGSRRRRKSSGSQSAMRRKFGSCAKSCRSDAPKSYGSCMRKCLRKGR